MNQLTFFLYYSIWYRMVSLSSHPLMGHILPIYWRTDYVWWTSSTWNYFRSTSYWPRYTLPVSVVTVAILLSCCYYLLWLNTILWWIGIDFSILPTSSMYSWNTVSRVVHFYLVFIVYFYTNYLSSKLPKNIELFCIVHYVHPHLFYREVFNIYVPLVNMVLY